MVEHLPRDLGVQVQISAIVIRQQNNEQTRKKIQNTEAVKSSSPQPIREVSKSPGLIYEHTSLVALPNKQIKITFMIMITYVLEYVLSISHRPPPPFPPYVFYLFNTLSLNWRIYQYWKLIVVNMLINIIKLRAVCNTDVTGW